MKCGVDFGTTTTTVAVADRGNYPVVSFEDGADTRDYVPSVVAFDDGKLVFGFEADRAARAGAPHIRSFKRFLADPDVTASTSIRLGYRDVELMDVLTRFLAHVADCVRTGSSVSRVRKSEPLEVAVGVPAHAWSGQRFLTLEAFKNAGWDVTTMLNEPSAAGFEYTHRHAGTLNSKRTSVLVYDLGGGTFDASIVEAAGRRHEVLGSRGLNLVGGDDFDTILANLLATAAGMDSARLGEQRWAALLDDARAAKEALIPQSRQITVAIDDQQVTIPVTAFYEAATPLVVSTIDALEPLLTKVDGVGQLGPDVAGLYVVGGGSQLPLISRVLRERFGRRVHRSPHTAASTAIGLAIGADPDSGFTVREQLSRGVGVFRELSSGSTVSFDTLLTPDMGRTPGQSAGLSRQYLAAHNVGFFRFVEYTSADEAGVPRGDIHPCGDVYFPFDRALQDSDADLSSVEVVRTDEGPLIQEHYWVDENGIVTVEIRDTETGYTVRKELGR